MKGLSLTIALSISIASPLAAEVTFERAHNLIQQYCVECHNPADEKGNLDLAVFESKADFLADPHVLEELEWVISQKEMPVPAAPKQPSNEERQEMVDWLVATLMEIQNAMPNDPGMVVMPRVSSKEFDYVIEDLTGREYTLSEFLTSDTASGEGFYNVGAGQNLSIGQFEGVMSVGKMLMNHARYIPGGGVWWMPGPQPVLEKDDELDEFLHGDLEHFVERTVLPGVVDHHIKQIERKTPYDDDEAFAAYLEAAWQYRYRHEFGRPGATVEQIAAAYDPPLFPSALQKTVDLLGEEQEDPKVIEVRENPIIAELIQSWMELPAPSATQPEALQKELDEVVKMLGRQTDESRYGRWEQRSEVIIPPQDGTEKREYYGHYEKGRGYLKIDPAKLEDNTVYLAATGRTYPGGFDPTAIWADGTVTMQDGSKRPWQEVATVRDSDGNPLPFGVTGPGKVAHKTPGYVAVTLPDQAKVFEVFAEYDPGESQQDRLLRVLPFSSPPDVQDTQPFYRAIAMSDRSDEGVKKARNKMGEAENIASAAFHRIRFSDDDLYANETDQVRQYVGAKPVASPEKRQNYRATIFSIPLEEMEARMEEALTESQLKHYNELRAAIRLAAANQSMTPEQALAEKRRVLTDFARLAWRQEPAPKEIDGLMGIYRQEKAKGVSTEHALETAMRTVTIAPKFLYRFSESRQSPEPYLLQGREIATRLAFVLWAGLPDQQLYELADSGQLANPEVLKQQIDRMLVDPKADRFIEEFFGRWLGFAEFDKFSGPDQEKFKAFTPELREAMYDEAQQFVKHMILEQKPVTDLFFADYTFLNGKLADHYGVDGVQGNQMQLVKMDNTARGGILGMGAFLTKTSTPLRTSPVHRGLWLYEHVLDYPVPEPPPVPLLSDEGVDEAGRTITEQLRQHRQDPACYSCHDRFDPLGVALENFDPIGRWREKVEDKAPVSSRGEFRSGVTIEGASGLRDFLGAQEDRLVEAFATKLLGYALGRSVLPTDQPTLEAMITSMRANGLTVRSALHSALTSPQFLQRRDPEVAELGSN